MTQTLKFAFFTLLAGSAAWIGPAARADEGNKETVLTFNEPVEIPGQILPAGSYVFKLANSNSDQDIVQIFNEDRTRLFATVEAIAVERAEPTDHTVVTFEERTSGSPEALRTWFYPGDIIGREFVYSKPQMQTAANQGLAPTATAAAPAPAPAASAPPQQAMTEQPAAQQPAAQQPAAQHPKDEPSVPVIVREQEVIIAQAVPAPADNASPPENRSAPANTLPQTAGNFASIPLLGILLLSGGFATIRFATKRS